MTISDKEETRKGLDGGQVMLYRSGGRGIKVQTTINPTKPRCDLEKKKKILKNIKSLIQIKECQNFIHAKNK